MQQQTGSAHRWRAVLYTCRIPAIIVLPLLLLITRQGWGFVIALAVGPVLAIFEVLILLITRIRAKNLAIKEIGPLTAWPLLAHYLGCTILPFCIGDANDQNSLPAPLQTLGLPEILVELMAGITAALAVLGGLVALVMGIIEAVRAHHR